MNKAIESLVEDLRNGFVGSKKRKICLEVPSLGYMIDNAEAIAFVANELQEELDLPVIPLVKSSNRDLNGDYFIDLDYFFRKYQIIQ